MIQHPCLTLPNDTESDNLIYYKLLQINLIVIEDHLVVLLYVPLVYKIFIYTAYNLPILYQMPQEVPQYSMEGEYLSLLSDGDYATTASEDDILL